MRETFVFQTEIYVLHFIYSYLVYVAVVMVNDPFLDPLFIFFGSEEST